MIKLEITDVSELKNLPIIGTYDLEKYLMKKYPDDFEVGKRLSYGLVEDILEYISKVSDTDDVCEVYLDMGADIKVTYGYLIK